MNASRNPARGAAVLIADDDPAIRLVLRHRLEADGHRVEEAIDSASALAALRSNRFDVALLDIIMPGNGGLDVLSAAHSETIRTLIIVITAASTMNNAVEAMKRGAHDYLTKPFANLDLVAAAIKRAVEVGAQAADLNRLKDEVNRQLVGGEIIGRSAAMQEVYKLIGRVVTNDATVLLSGESGTGKELVARAIHFKSARWRSPFVAVNCSAIPHGLLESELFGHERGSFTGASERRAGKFEMADTGTIFLDEIGDLPVELQPKLLRVLQEREFTRVGSVETLKVKARVIAATNQNLETLVAARKFREDLYFRLRVIPIQMPALRERRDDIARADRLLRLEGGPGDGRARDHYQPRGAQQARVRGLAGQRARTRKCGDARGAARARHHDSRRRHRAVASRRRRRRINRRDRRRRARRYHLDSHRGMVRFARRRGTARPLPSAGRGDRASAGRARTQARRRQPGSRGADARAQSQHAAQEDHRPQDRTDQISRRMTRLPSHFYAMVDTAGGHDPVSLAETLLDAGVRIMQLRLKDAPGRDFLAAARAIAEMCRKRGATLIVNDRVDIAILADAHGVHLGQTDLPLEAARRIAGSNENMMIGISTHNVEQARAAENGGADYIGFGPMYPGGLRNNVAGKGLDNLRAIRAAVKIPIVAIGGITEARVAETLAAGADAVAIITDVVNAPDIASQSPLAPGYLNSA